VDAYQLCNFVLSLLIPQTVPLDPATPPLSSGRPPNTLSRLSTMTDPISVIGLGASLQQLTSFAVTVVGKLYAYYGNVTKAPEQAARLREELSTAVFLHRSKRR
jgi:hypothetical protein